MAKNYFPTPTEGRPRGFLPGVESRVSWSARAVITKYHRLAGSTSTHFLSRRSGGCKSERRIPVWSGSGERPLLGEQMAACWLRAHVAFPLSLCLKRDVSLFVFFFWAVPRTQKFWGQGLNPRHNSNPSHQSDNAGSREVPPFPLLKRTPSLLIRTLLLWPHLTLISS